MTGLMVPKQDFRAICRVVGFSDYGKGEYVVIDEVIQRIKGRAKLRQAIEDDTF